MSYEIIKEWCWTCSRSELFNVWSQQHQQPALESINLNILHYNIRYYHSNKCDLIDMVEKYKPAIITLNELGAIIPIKVIEKALFSYKVFKTEGTNAHGGVVLAIDKNLNPINVDCKQTKNIVAASIMINNKTYTITSIYSPPAEPLPLEIMSFVMQNSQHIIIAGDFNAKNYDWGCPEMNIKGQKLKPWLDANKKIHIHNQGMITSLRSETTIDLIISTEQQSSVHCQALPYFGSDHLPILTEFTNIKINKQQRNIPKINWDIYTSILTILNPEINQIKQDLNMNPSEWFKFFEQLLYALKLRSTHWHTIEKIRPSITKALRVMLKHKHYLQNRYRHTRSEEDRQSLRAWHKLVLHEFNQHKVNRWNKFIDNVASPQPTTFWKTIKILNKKRSVKFSAITENNKIHRTPDQILSCLTQHFKARFQAPSTDLTVKTDKEALDLWKLLEQAQPEDIQLISQQSDLTFTTKEVWEVLKSLKPKNSSSFDNISNKMIKNIPEGYAQILTEHYNALFADLFWQKQWKQSRTICFNKVESAAPTTQQLRPISLLPVLGKVYERLFLIRFKKWLFKYGILPWQQSGARSNQCTTSRLNHMLEQTYASLLSNTFTPIIFVDFLQAFDLLWQEGLLLKLKRLNCPFSYLIWIKNYFTDRSMFIDLNGQISEEISVKRGAPQGSVFGAIAYIVAHHDLQQVFQNPENNHLYVDDLGSVYIPSLYEEYKDQLTEIQKRINKDLIKLHDYAVEWHQPVNSKKTEYVVFDRVVKSPKLKIYYNGNQLEQKKNFKYLGYRLDSKLSFNCVVVDHLQKCRQTYTILKYIHNRFPSFFKLKQRFFNTYVWPHLHAMSSIYCLLSKTQRDKINGFYRRCLRIIYHLFQCSTNDLHGVFQLPTLEEKYRKTLTKRLSNIERYEQELIQCYLMHKNIINTTRHHYREKAIIQAMPIGRPSTRMLNFYNKSTTYFDKLINFCYTHHTPEEP
ncbi:unnamed protein product [Adineta steineri]|uniref:Reverse transcriptase domain-containing protein n=2 Tax=Adineta steineri TaxID=433720 RepID=A0A818TYG7_9BILA|nr:unnamed protein product [Adineta steineri]CAF3693820.1 unnamed protein product [Adineta steineri]